MGMIGTLLAAGLVGACCAGPTLFLLFGVSVASLGALGRLEPYRPIFLGVGILCWGLAYRARRCAAHCEEGRCEGRPRSRVADGFLWGSLIALVVATLYPYAIARIAG